MEAWRSWRSICRAHARAKQAPTMNGQEVSDGHLHCEGYDWLSAHHGSSPRWWWWCNSIVKERGRKSTGTIYTFFLTRAWRYCFGRGSASAAALPGRTDRGGKPTRSGLDLFFTFKVSRGIVGARYNTMQHKQSRSSSNTSRVSGREVG